MDRFRILTALLLALGTATSCNFFPFQEIYYALAAKVDDIEMGDITLSQMDDAGAFYLSSFRSHTLMRWSEEEGLEEYFDFDEEIASFKLDSAGETLYLREGTNLWEIDTGADTKRLVGDTFTAESEGIVVVGAYIAVGYVDDADWPPWEGILLIRRSDFAEADRIQMGIAANDCEYIVGDHMLLVHGVDEYQDTAISFLGIDEGTGTLSSVTTYSRWSPPFEDFIPRCLGLSGNGQNLFMSDGTIYSVNGGNLMYEGIFSFDDFEFYGQEIIRDACFFGGALVAATDFGDGTRLTIHRPVPAYSQKKPQMILDGGGRKFIVSGENLYLLIDNEGAYTTGIYRFDTSICD